MNILFLCRKKDLSFGQASLARALERRGVRVTCVDDDVLLNEDINKLVARCPEQPSLILHPELDFPLLPQGLEQIEIPTACFQIDTYAYTERRIRWSMLFDYSVLFHLGFEEVFREGGHPNPVTMLHAVDRESFASPTGRRSLEVAAVGRCDGPNYKTRRRVLAKLGESFRMNEWERWHSYAKLAQVYCATKIVVNVGRDDYPTDVSLRFAEAMAARALFITLLPSEMSQLGFLEGVHFVGAHSEAEIPELTRYYLDREAERIRIADAGREKVLREHTYDSRAEQLLQTIEQNKGKLFAPARAWPEARVRLARLDYFSANREFSYACAELGRIARTDSRSAWAGAALVARGLASRARGRLNQFLERERIDGRA